MTKTLTPLEYRAISVIYLQGTFKTMNSKEYWNFEGKMKERKGVLFFLVFIEIILEINKSHRYRAGMKLLLIKSKKFLRNKNIYFFFTLYYSNRVAKGKDSSMIHIIRQA